MNTVRDSVSGGCHSPAGVRAASAWYGRLVSAVPLSPRHDASPSPVASNASETGLASTVRGDTATGAAPAAAGSASAPSTTQIVSGLMLHKRMTRSEVTRLLNLSARD